MAGIGVDDILVLEMCFALHFFFFVGWRSCAMSSFMVILFLYCRVYLLSHCLFVSCVSLPSGPERDAERVWHLMARSNRSWSTAGVNGVDVDGMRTENGCVPSLRFMTEFDWWLRWPPRTCQGDHLDPQVTLGFTLRGWFSFFFTTSSLSPLHLKL